MTVSSYGTTWLRLGELDGQLLLELMPDRTVHIAWRQHSHETWPLGAWHQHHLEGYYIAGLPTAQVDRRLEQLHAWLYVGTWAYDTSDPRAAACVYLSPDPNSVRYQVAQLELTPHTTPQGNR